MNAPFHHQKPFRQRLGLLGGAFLCLVMLLLPPPTNMDPTAWNTAAMGCLMAVWWISEAIPIPATALLPLVFFPILEILPAAQTAAPYAHPIIFLFLGGFIMAQALESCGLHRRFALGLLRLTGNKPSHTVGGFMIATALISMGVSNTATMVMMYPMALSVIDAQRGNDLDKNFPIALLLGTAYAANIGGIGTLIGTPPNALLAGFMAETYEITIGFGQWMLIGLPLVLIALPLTWLLLTRWLYPLNEASDQGHHQYFEGEAKAMGPLTQRQTLVGAVILLAALAWIFRPQLARFIPGLNDTSIAIAGALAMFLLPESKDGNQTFSWDAAEKLPWSVLVLFGGGLSLASAINQSGLAVWIGHQLIVLEPLPILMITLTLTVVMLLLTELTSNTATTAVFLPIVGSIAIGLGVDPLFLALPVALAASCAFMMPVATPPNAIVFGTGRLEIHHMMRAGVWLNIIMLLLINAAVFLLGSKILG